jgi:hypothetical protein
MGYVTDKSPKCRLRVRITEFSYPPIHDGLVIGKQAPLGLESFRKAISLLMTSTFEHVDLDDDVIGDILIRSAVLRRISREKIVRFVLESVKPLMSGEEILHLDLHAEIEIEEESL